MSLLYQKRRLKVNKIKRRINSLRANLQRLRILFSLIMIAGIIYLGMKIVKLPQWYLDTAALNAANPHVLKIQGNIITPTYKIIDAIRQAQLPMVQIFRLDTKELEDNIEQLQVIKKVYVRRYWFPARLIVSIEERTPAFLLVPNLEVQARQAVTSDGGLIDHDYLPFPSSVKTKKLLTYGIVDGVDETWDKKKVEDLLKLVKAFEYYSNQEVQYIDIRNPKEVYIMLKEYLVLLGEINESCFDRVKSIASVLPELKKRNIEGKVKYIDLRWKECYIRLEGTEDSKEKIKSDNHDIEIKIKSKDSKQNVDKQEDLNAEKPAKQEEKPKEQQESPYAAAASLEESEAQGNVE